jgi:hypothetical protein
VIVEVVPPAHATSTHEPAAVVVTLPVHAVAPVALNAVLLPAPVWLAAAPSRTYTARTQPRSLAVPVSVTVTVIEPGAELRYRVQIDAWSATVSYTAGPAVYVPLTESLMLSVGPVPDPVA